MNVKNTFILFFFMTLGFRSMAQDPCVCPEIYAPVCGVQVLQGDTLYLELPNACFAQCLGFTIVSDSTLCDSSNPWGNCDCPEPDSTFVCATDSLGITYQVPSACYAACWGLTVVPDSLCNGNPWGNCDCPEPDGTFVCASDSSGFTFQVPSACYAACWGLTVVADSLCNGNPWGNCDCPEPDSTFVCATDSTGFTFQVPNACFAACWGLTVVPDSLCNANPWSGCDCTIDNNEPFVCAVDSLGHACQVPNACFAACWGLTVVEDSICGDIEVIDPEFDYELMACIDSLNIGENTLFQEALLQLQSCGIELPSCIINAPLFTSDSAFITYIINNCDSLGFNGNEASNVMNSYNLLNNSLSKTKNTNVTLSTSLKLAVNPTSNDLTYYIDSKKAANAQITLFDIHGKAILSSNHQISEGKQMFREDISSIKAGLYMLNLRTNEGQQTVKVMIVD